MVPKWEANCVRFTNNVTLVSSKQMEDDKKMKQVERSVQLDNTSGVVIRVYEESERPRSRKLSQNSVTQKGGGYDRRAQLLAHSRQLRNMRNSDDHVPLPTIHSQTKSKSKKRFLLTKPVRICFCSPSRYMRCGRARYEQDTEETKRSNNRNSVEIACTPFLSKMKKLLKELSCKEI